jgi:hypothetical protein
MAAPAPPPPGGHTSEEFVAEDSFSPDMASPEAQTLSKAKRKVSAVKEMGIAAGGSINQTIERDTYPVGLWDVSSSILLNIQILDSEAFTEVTGLPPLDTPIDAETYARHGYPFFEIWGEEKTGIVGQFAEVKSVAQIEEERAKEKGEAYEKEKSVPQRVHVIGRFSSTFKPLDTLVKEIKDLRV